VQAVDLEGQLVMAFDSKKPHSGDVEGVCRRNQQGRGLEVFLEIFP
jgi:hypothetical protein